MYYEEQVINGVLHCRYEPNGEWHKVSLENLTAKYLQLQHHLRQTKESAQANAEKLESFRIILGGV